MPPGPVYNWLAVAHSLTQIFEHAAQYRTTQLALTATSTRRSEGSVTAGPPEHIPRVQQSSLYEANEAWFRQLSIPASRTRAAGSAPLQTFSAPGTGPVADSSEKLYVETEMATLIRELLPVLPQTPSFLPKLDLEHDVRHAPLPSMPTPRASDMSSSDLHLMGQTTPDPFEPPVSSPRWC
jgi:hypothetical protein